MAETFEIKEIEEKVILVGISEQDGDDANDSLLELAELVKTAGATVVGTLIQNREKNSSGNLCGNRKGVRNRPSSRRNRCNRYRM